MKIRLSITSVLIVFLAMSNALFSQKQDVYEIGKEIWSDNDFSDQVPKKWGNESAVIIYQKFYNEYVKVALSGKLQHVHITRKRIKLNDKAAINKFSIFEYDPIEISRKGAENAMLIKVIKPNGKAEIIDDANAEDIVVNGVVTKKKLAVPNLSVGDIIDYFKIDRTVYKKVGSYFEFPIEYHTLSSEYNVMKQVIDFKVLRRCHIAYKSMNKAPDFKKIGTQDDDYFNYVLVDVMREKYKGITWVNRIGELPSIKFKVIYATGGYAADDRNFYNTDLVLKDVSKSDVLEISKKIVDKHMPGFISGDMYSKVYQDAITELSKEIKLDAVDKLKSFYQKSLLAINSYDFKYKHKNIYAGKAPLKREVSMYYPLMAYCKKQGLQYSFILAPNKYRSEVDDIISLEELTPLLKVKVGSEEIIFYYDIAFYAPGEYPYVFQGVESYDLQMTKSFKTWKLQKYTTPALTDNFESNKMVVKPQFSENIIQIKNRSELAGYVKTNKLKEVDFNTSELYTLYSYNPASVKMIDVSDGKRSKFSIARSTYGNSFKVYDNDFERMGHSFFAPTMLYNEYIEVENRIKKATDKIYLVSLYDIVSNQMRVDNDEREERDVNIQMTTPRYYENNITFLKVEGYDVSNIKSLNATFENNVGQFTAKVVVTDEGFLLESKKVYKKAYYEKVEWEEAIKFTDFVYDYFHKKLSYIKN